MNSRLRLFSIAATLLCASLALSQGTRIGQPIETSSTGSTILQYVPSSQITLYNAPCLSLPCSSLATTYTDSTLTTACPTSAQVVLDGTSSCSIASDPFGNWGMWVAPGQYCYTYTAGIITSGPACLTASSAVPGAIEFGGFVGAGGFSSLASCYAALSPGKVCAVQAGWTDPAWTANLTVNKQNTGIRCLGACTFPQGAFQVIEPGNTFGVNVFCVTLCTFNYSGSGSAWSIGTASATVGESIFLTNVLLNLTAGGSAIGFDMYNMGGGSRFLGTNVSNTAGTPGTTIGYRCSPSLALGGCQGDAFTSISAAGTLIWFQDNGGELNYFYGAQTFPTTGSPAPAGTIGFDCEGCNSDQLFGGSISGQKTAINCNFCLNVVANIETEGNFYGGNDVVLSGGSTGNDILLSGSTTKTLSGSGTNNRVCQSGTRNCLIGTTGTGSYVQATSPAISNPTTTGTDSGTETLQNKALVGLGASGTNTFTLTPNGQVFNSSGTLTIPAGVTAMECTVVAGGAAGAGATTSAPGCGGGSGGISVGLLTGLTPASTLTVTVGSGGTAVSGASGNPGTNSSIASGTQSITSITANAGGSPGTSLTCTGGNGGTSGTGGVTPLYVSGGNDGLPYVNIASGPQIGGPGAPGPFGGGHKGTGANNPGNNGTGPGAGGSGTFTTSSGTQPGGSGSNGIVFCKYVN